jgi:hypothetical protein
MASTLAKPVGDVVEMARRYRLVRRAHRRFLNLWTIDRATELFQSLSGKPDPRRPGNPDKVEREGADLIPMLPVSRLRH